MRIITRAVIPALLFGWSACSVSAANWDLSGEIFDCAPIACGLIGIVVGSPVAGSLTANDEASGPNSNFTETDITDFQFVVQELLVSVPPGELVMADLGTDESGEIAAGSLEISFLFDGGVGLIDLSLTIDVGAGTFQIDTEFLGLGVVAGGTVTFIRQQAADSDGDGVPDNEDNCLLIANADQRDTNGDNIGNDCDADFNNDCTVNFIDLGVMKEAFFTADADVDLDGDGNVNFLDLGLMNAGFFLPPGPSGIPNDCD